MNIYEYFSYKAFLIDLINKEKFKVSQLSEMAECNRSYFSQMLNGKAQLTTDHLINLSEHLSLNHDEKEFFINLGLLERASLGSTRELLEAKLDKMRQKSLVLSRKIKTEGKSFELTEEMKSDYYSNWFYGQVHIMTSIEQYQTVYALSERLKIKQSAIKKILNQLLEMRLVTKSGNKYFHQSQNLHIPQSSSHNFVNHTNWRMRALQNIPNEAGIHYTCTFAISKKSVPGLKSKLLEYIKEQREDIGKSGAEEVYCFNCDLFESF